MAIVSERFHGLALSVAKARKVPEFPIVVLPSNIEELSPDELQALAEESFPAAIEKLTHQ